MYIYIYVYIYMYIYISSRPPWSSSNFTGINSINALSLSLYIYRYIYLYDHFLHHFCHKNPHFWCQNVDWKPPPTASPCSWAAMWGNAWDPSWLIFRGNFHRKNMAFEKIDGKTWENDGKMMGNPQTQWRFDSCRMVPPSYKWMLV